MARPTKYKPEYAELAKELCMHGAIDTDLAREFKVDVSTISLWKVKHPEFKEALKVSKAVADNQVEDSLYRLANGYTRNEIEVKVVAGKVVKVPVERYYPPNAVAQIFWLKNRKSASWSDKQEVQHTGTVELTDRIMRARRNAAPSED